MRVAHNPQGPPTGGRSMSPTIKRAAPSASPMQIHVDGRSGSLAMLAAMRRASSSVSKFVSSKADVGELPAVVPLTMKQASVASSTFRRRREAARRHVVTLTVRWREAEKRGPRRGGYHAACCATGAKYSGGLRTYRSVLPADAKRRQLNFGLKDSRG